MSHLHERTMGVQRTYIVPQRSTLSSASLTMYVHCQGHVSFTPPTSEQKTKLVPLSRMDEGRKRVIGIMASILASLHMQTADDLFGTPEGSPRTDKLIEASIQWAERIMA